MDYLNEFKRKHGLTDEECGMFRKSDIEFDIDTLLPPDALDQWKAHVLKNGYVSLQHWICVLGGYAPQGVKGDQMDAFRSEMEQMLTLIENSLNSAFFEGFDEEVDFGDSDE